MKISPVTSTTPFISNAPQTGNSPEKLAKLKAIAAGETPKEEEKDKPEGGPKPLTPSIKMVTNRSTNQPIEGTEEPLAEVKEPESAISDNSVPTNAATEATAPLSPQLAMLAKQRRALQQERAAFEKEKASQQGPTRAELEAKIKTQPLSVLQELGVTYDQLTQDILAAQGQQADPRTIKEDILKAVDERLNKSLGDKDAATEKAVLAEMRRNINRMAAEGDDYEMIRETGSHQDVLDLIYRTYKQYGEVMDEGEAMKLVEEELVNESLKIAKLKKVQRGLTPQTPAEATAPPTQGGTTRQMRTLTNKDSASPAMTRRQRAILAAQGNLKR